MSLVSLGVLVLWVAALTAGFNAYFHDHLAGQAGEVLHARAEAAAATVEVTAAHRILVRETADDSVLDQGIWVYQGDRAVERPVGSTQLQARADALAVRGSGSVRLGGGSLMQALPVVDHGTRLGSVVAAVSLVPYRHAEQTALIGSAGVAVLFLLGAYPALRLAARRALAPVDAMTRQAAEWSAHAGGERFGVEYGHRELQHLASTLDNVLDRLSAVVRHEQQLSAELSHELRTPLSRIVAETDVLLSRPHTAEQQLRAHEGIHDSSVHMARILDTLLTTARSDFAGPMGQCALGPVVEHAAHSGNTAISVHVEDPHVLLGVDEAVAERIFAPILANALRFAEHDIRITARRTAGQVWVDVADDGPGIPVEFVEDVFRPGFRTDRRDGHFGAGLGLSLARRLARSSDGDVLIVAPARTGATVRVCLPPA